MEIRTRTQTLSRSPDLSRTFPAREPQIKILPDDSPACLGSLLFRLTRNKAGATELVPLLIATDGYGWPLCRRAGATELVPLLSLLHRPSR